MVECLSLNQYVIPFDILMGMSLLIHDGIDAYRY